MESNGNLTDLNLKDKKTQNIKLFQGSLSSKPKRALLILATYNDSNNCLKPEDN